MSTFLSSRHLRDVRHRCGNVIVDGIKESPNNDYSKSKHSPNRSPRKSQDASEIDFLKTLVRNHCIKFPILILLLITAAMWMFLLHPSYHVSWYNSNSNSRMEESYTLRNRTNDKMRVTISSTMHRNENIISFKQHVIYLEGSWTAEDWSYLRRKTRLLPNSASVSNILNEWSEYRDSKGRSCKPKADWQTKSFPNCNTVHEIDFAMAVAMEVIDHDRVNASFYSSEDELNLLGEGWFRTTWRLNRYLPSDMHKHHSKTVLESLVLKTLRIEREFLSEYFELHRRDAVAMERLTASSFVVDVFGFCGQSAINELASFHIPGVQNLEAFDRRLRALHSYQVSVIKLRLAASVAIGLADIHAAGERHSNHNARLVSGKNDVYMVHYDMNPRNIALFAGGKPKINDFNIAEFLRYDPLTNETCGFPSRLHEPWWRAPEEMNVNATEQGILVDEKVDLYALGNILFHILTSHSPWGKMKPERIPDVRPKVAKGIRPPIPNQFLKDKNPHTRAIVKAIESCWVTDPTKRASAEDVASILFRSLMDVKEIKLLDEDNLQGLRL